MSVLLCSDVCGIVGYVTRGSGGMLPRENLGF